MGLAIVKRPHIVPQSSENSHLIISSASRLKAAGLGLKHCEDKQQGCDKSILLFMTYHKLYVKTDMLALPCGNGDINSPSQAFHCGKVGIVCGQCCFYCCTSLKVKRFVRQWLECLKNHFTSTVLEIKRGMWHIQIQRCVGQILTN